jgi:hypothetical protein
VFQFRKNFTMNRLLVFLIWLLPLLIFMILGENGFGISPFFVGLILLLLFFAAGAVMGGGGCSEEEEKKEESIWDERIRSLANDLQPFLAVKGWKAVDEIVQFEGSLRTDPAGALKGINDNALADVMGYGRDRGERTYRLCSCSARFGTQTVGGRTDVQLVVPRRAAANLCN